MTDTRTPTVTPENNTKNETANTPTVEAATPQPTLTTEAKQEIQNATGSAFTKVIWWVVGIIGTIGALIAGILGILYLLKKKGPLEGVQNVIDKSKSEMAKADMEAKIKVAEAQNAEQEVIDQLKEIKKIDDEKAQLDALNNLLDSALSSNKKEEGK